MPNVKGKPKEKKEMEYPDAPSGYVTLYNYKEPFMKYSKGFGYQGVLLFDGETDKVQCHLCGGWYMALSNHLVAEHNMRAAAYKEEVGLNYKTALIGEKLRAKLIASGLNKRLQNLRNQKGIKRSEETKEKIRKALQENRRENQNRLGTCPEQLIDRIQKIYKEHGKSFSVHQHLDNMDETLRRNFGSIRQALELAGIPYRKPGQNKNYDHRIKYTFENIADAFHDFFLKNNRLPRNKDFPKHWLAMKRGKMDQEKLMKLAISKDGVYRRQSKVLHFSKEELLEFLRKFEKINSRKPSYSDSRRGLLPVLSRYSYHFGSWKNALKLAFESK